MTPRRRQAEKHASNDTREALLDAATAVFGSRGYAAASLQDIASEAGLTTGAVYSNYRGKGELALAVLGRQLRKPQLALFEEVDHESSAQEQFEDAVRLLVAQLDAARPWFLLELECTAHAARNPSLLALFRASEEEARQALAHAISTRFAELGWTTTIPSDALAAVLVAVTNGLALQRLADASLISEDMIQQILGAVLVAFTDTATAPISVPADS